MENLIKNINAELSLVSSALAQSQIPNMENLESYMAQFDAGLKKLTSAQQKDYAEILKIWADQSRDISEKLTELMKELKAQMNTATTQTKAFKAYTNS